jgi:hypothetical protein
MNDLILFAATATLFTFYAKRAASEKTCDASLKNSAFVFVKPHANTPMVQKLVREKLVAAGCTILSEIDIDGKTIDEQKLIDQHYYAIGACFYLIWSSTLEQLFIFSQTGRILFYSIQSDFVIGQGYSRPQGKVSSQFWGVLGHRVEREPCLQCDGSLCPLSMQCHRFG